MTTCTFPTLPPDTEPWFRQLAQVVEETFPDGFDQELYHPFARILLDYCSFRTVGQVLAWLKGQHDYIVGYHDMMVADSQPPDEAVVRRLRERLEAHGLKEWATANEL